MRILFDQNSTNKVLSFVNESIIRPLTSKEKTIGLVVLGILGCLALVTSCILYHLWNKNKKVKEIQKAAKQSKGNELSKEEKPKKTEKSGSTLKSETAKTLPKSLEAKPLAIEKISSASTSLSSPTDLTKKGSEKDEAASKFPPNPAETKPIAGSEIVEIKVPPYKPSLQLMPYSRERGLDIQSLYLNQKIALNHIIKVWKKEMEKSDYNPSDTKTREELATLFNMDLWEIEELCFRLQILQTDIPHKLITYYFGAIQRELNPKTLPSEITEPVYTVSLPHRFNGDLIILAHAESRFPGKQAKDTWSLEELSMYLSLKQNFLKSELDLHHIDVKDDVYHSEDISEAFLQNLENVIAPLSTEEKNAIWTQKDSIRFCGYGTGTRPV